MSTEPLAAHAPPVIHYRERMRVAEQQLRDGHYQYVVRECGTLLEVALRSCYQRLLDLTSPAKMARVREVERGLCSASQSYADLGLGKLVRLIHDARVFERLEAREGRSYADVRSFNFNHIVQVDARNAATHRAAIPDEITARLAHANLMAFLKAVYLLELPPELQQANEEAFSALLIRHWGKGYLSEADVAEQAERARSLGLDAATVARLQKQVEQDLQALISAHAASLPPVFEPPPLRPLQPQHNLPTLLASQVQQELKHYLLSTFPMRSAHFKDLLPNFLAAPDQLLRGPYLSLCLPFQTGSRQLGDFFPQLRSRFAPYLHQEQAFERLSGPRPRPTLVATGTGSGKTECFLYPLLQHCYQQRSHRGIKALIIYPMNALATDQARRIARLIWQNPALKGQINAGLYVGDRSGQESALMGEDHLITRREALREAPPDILLTNYKMLDLLLTRPEDQPLWRHNSPETLQFLVVDEIHTFDGAQGTDLACLIRRLKARLDTPPDHLCPVGTSATLGAEKPGAILDYASQIFGESFDATALIQEQRQTYADFLFEAEIAADPEIPHDWLPLLQPENYSAYSDYVQTQYKIWFGTALPESGRDWRVALGEALKTLPLFQNLVRQLRDQHLTRAELLQALSKRYAPLREAPPAYGPALLDSLLALVSSARSIPSGFAEVPDPPLMPFLQVRAQLWLRELRRLVVSLDPRTPQIYFADDKVQDPFAQLPLVHCRECHHVAWGARRQPHRNQYSSGLQEFYQRYRQAREDLWLLYPDAVQQPGHLAQLSQWLCPVCLHFAQNREDIPHSQGQCQPEDCFEISALPLYPPGEKTSDGGADCQICSGQGSLNIVGQRASTLTAVMIAQIFGSDYSADKKIIAFSDSVQDASYRAGFFTARTYSFTLRTALQQYFDQLPAASREGPEALSLPEIAPDFSRYWQAQHGDAQTIAQFFPADLTWLAEYEALCQNQGRFESPAAREDFMYLLNQRLGFEIYRELTFRSRTGRTLEKAGLAMVSLPLPALAPVLDDLQLLLPEQFPQLGDALSRTALQQVLALLLQQLKRAGVVYHPALDTLFSQHLPYGLYVNTPNLKAPIWLPRNQGFAGPGPLVMANSRLASLQLSQRRSWYQWLLERLLQSHEDSLMYGAQAEALLLMLLQQLVRHQILLSCPKGPQPGWALNPARLQLSTDLAPLRCSSCQHEITVPAAELTHWTQSPCGRRPCAEGRYLPADSTDSYYARYYRQATPRRVFAAEHTGLLARAERERIETEFMAGAATREQQPWFTNLLSSTPTLEMGIDIGDLSTVLLCSVPPTQSNYLQRIGRSGRSDGNSLNLTVATGRPHDLYYFREPLEMMAGAVQTPGVFLGAAAVLERQLTAYCFDRWVATGIGPEAIDKTLRPVLANLSKASPDPTRFPHNLLAFITAHQLPLFEGFMALFGPELPPAQREEIHAHLWAFLQGEAEGSLSYKILERLTHVAQSCKNFQNDISLLKGRIQRAEEHPERLDAAGEQELAQMHQELSGLRALLRQLRDKQVFNFLSDEGLLPNYAFPEEGITLRSVVYRKRQPSTLTAHRSHYETFEYEYVRPAAAALVELAPNNHFYAGGRKVQINQVELRFGDSNSPGFESWRFCDQCSHMAPESAGTSPARACPRCGSPGWADTGQVHRLVRMRQVFANTNIRDSLHLDRSEERSSLFFNKDLRVDFAPEAVMQAYQLNEVQQPFGFEYIRQASLREINFGELDTDFKGEARSLQGQGFVLCSSCGMVQAPRVLSDPRAKARHAITCRRPKNNPGPQDVFASAFLYRIFQSEALRIFLPDDPRFDGETCTQSFIAALQLGLRSYFAGNIDHIAATVQTEALPGQNRQKAFLVLYDQVPGGTGYLKQLCRPGAERPVLLEVLQAAQDQLRSCACQQDPALDGCYRCILSYRQIYHLEALSRTTAIELLASILQHADRLLPVASIHNMRPANLQESELERRFLEALRRLARPESPLYQRLGGLKLTPDVINGKLGYLLQVGQRHYSIEPQVSLGAAEGVSVPSRADFVIRSLRAEEHFRPIAVYTDGYRYHHDRLDQDTAQRMALQHSGRYLSWSLSWEDIDQHLAERPETGASLAFLPADLRQQPLYKLLAGHAAGTLVPELLRLLGPLLQQGSALELLLVYLAHPLPADWQRLGELLQILSLPSPAITPAESQLQHRQFKEQLLSLDPELYALSKVSETGSPPRHYFFPALIPPAVAPAELLQSFARLPQEALLGAAPADGQPHAFQLLLLDDSDTERPGFQAVWALFLRLLNLLQFGACSWAVTRRGLDAGLYSPVIAQRGRQEQAPVLDAAWRELEDQLLDDSHLPLLHTLARGGCALPTLGYEPVAADGAVLGLLEYAFVEQRFALVLPEDLEDLRRSGRLARVEAQGWTLLPLSAELLDAPELLLADYAIQMGAPQ